MLVPGSAFEKMLVQFVVRFVLYIPLALVLFKVEIFLAIASMVPDPKTGFDPLFVDQLSYGDFFTPSEVLRNNPLQDLAYLFVAFAGSVYIRRYAAVKTLSVLVIIPGLLVFIAKLSGEKIEWIKNVTDYLNGRGYYLSLAPVIVGILLLSLPWIYFKLKEKEL